MGIVSFTRVVADAEGDGMLAHFGEAGTNSHQRGEDVTVDVLAVDETVDVREQCGDSKARFELAHHPVGGRFKEVAKTPIVLVEVVTDG